MTDEPTVCQSLNQSQSALKERWQTCIITLCFKVMMTKYYSHAKRVTPTCLQLAKKNRRSASKILSADKLQENTLKVVFENKNMLE